MNKKNLVAICYLLIACISSGCMKMAIKKHKIGREFNFTDRNRYFSQISKENGIDVSYFLLLDSADYMKFGSSTTSIYYGCFINDSTQIKKTDWLMDNQSCMGRIGHEIEHIMLSNRPDTIALDSSVNLSNFGFYSAVDNKRIRIIHPDKKLTIVLVYFYSMGTYYRSLFKEILEAQQKFSSICNLYVVSMDPVCYLK